MPASASDSTAPPMADTGTTLGVSNPGGSFAPESNWMMRIAPLTPRAPLSSVRNAPSRKNWNRMLRLVAPRALRSPISRVRSVTATSMMLMMPIAPSASVTSPTPPRNQSMAVKILPMVFWFFTVSHSSQVSLPLGSKPPWLRATICASRPWRLRSRRRCGADS